MAYPANPLKELVADEHAITRAVLVTRSPDSLFGLCASPNKPLRGATATYSYNGDGLWVKSVVGSTTTSFT